MLLLPFAVSLTKTAKKGLELKQNLIEEVSISFVVAFYLYTHGFTSIYFLFLTLIVMLNVFSVAKMCGHVQKRFHLLCGKHEKQQTERLKGSMETQSVRCFPLSENFRYIILKNRHLICNFHFRFFFGKNKVMMIALGKGPTDEYKDNLHKVNMFCSV